MHARHRRDAPRRRGTELRIASALGVVLATCALVALALAWRAGAPDLSVAAESDGPLRVYVVVVDGMKPSDVSDVATPNLAQLKDSGTWYDQPRAVFPAETLPNHVAMSTGVLPRRNGIIGNQRWRPNSGGTAREYMEHPGFLEADTIVTRLERGCEATGGLASSTVMSKTYLFGVFRGEPLRDVPRGRIATDPLIAEPSTADDPNPQREADFHWDPREAPTHVGNPSYHTPDPETMDAFLTWVRGRSGGVPQFGFLNLGDVDRAGHIDATGGTTSGLEAPFQQAAIEDTDAQIGRLVDELEQSGAWDDTVLILLSDHGMDFGPYNNRINPTEVLQGEGYVADDSGDFWVVGGGGSGLVWVHDPANVNAIAGILAGTNGVDYVATRQRVPGLAAADNPTFAELGIDHPNSPDVEVFAKPHWRVDDSFHGNPLPGNHGHSATQRSSLLVTGGHPALRDSPTSVPGTVNVDDPPGAARFVPPADGPGSLSVAATVAALYGIGEPAGGYDGKPLVEAFDPGALPVRGGCRAAATSSGGEGTRPAPASGPAPVQDGGGPAAPRSAGAVSTTLTARPQVVRLGRALRLSGRASGPSACPGPYGVSVYERTLGSRAARPRVVATSARTRPDGTWALSHRPSRNAEYVAFARPTEGCTSAPPAARRVGVRAALALRVPASCGAATAVTGRLRPANPGSAVLLQRWTGRRFRTVARGRLDARSRLRLALPACRGHYRVVWPGRPGVNLGVARGFRR